MDHDEQQGSPSGAPPGGACVKAAMTINVRAPVDQAIGIAARPGNRDAAEMSRGSDRHLLAHNPAHFPRNRV
ncbi:hypothetical protein AB0D46_32155 [Streptomyces sp. NPDC048383]|uniref:hypothetical protein n=1 Tax=Streptomyces sp. NPDC048383 TaxID=3155386 RepID=UPI00341607D2